MPLNVYRGLRIDPRKPEITGRIAAHLKDTMTPAERQKLKRDRRKAGLVRLELWVPADKEAEVRALAAAATQHDAALPKETTPP